MAGGACVACCGATSRVVSPTSAARTWHHGRPCGADCRACGGAGGRLDGDPTAFTARARHVTRPVVFAPDAPSSVPRLELRFQVRRARHAFPAPPAFRGPLRRFLRASLARGSPRASASRITAETDVCAASASAASAAAVAGSTVTRNCAEYRDSRLYRRCG